MSWEVRTFSWTDGSKRKTYVRHQNKGLEIIETEDDLQIIECPGEDLDGIFEPYN